MISSDADYPVSLRHIALPPKVLYIKGNLPRLDCSIGIVGSRRASTYGLKAAGDFAADLASAGLVIVAVELRVLIVLLTKVLYRLGEYDCRTWLRYRCCLSA